MAKGDFYPASMDARAAWHPIFAAQLPTFATKYGISAADVTKAVADAAWMTAAVALRHALNDYSQQVTKWFNDIAGNDPTKVKPEVLADFSVAGLGADVAPGIEYRTRGWAEQIKNNAAYSEADGEAMGIEGAEQAAADPGGMTPELKFKTLANFELEVTFRLFGMDAVKFQFRYKGGDWHNAGFLVTSPGVLSIPPQVAGTAEQIEIRAVFVEKNNEVGSYTDAKTALIAP